jgi:hypothetical protein
VVASPLGIDGSVRGVRRGPLRIVQVLREGIRTHSLRWLIDPYRLEQDGIGSRTVNGGAVMGRNNNVGEIAAAHRASAQKRECRQA